MLDQGNAVRAVAATDMNETSSRSHSCFTIKIERKTVTSIGPFFNLFIFLFIYFFEFLTMSFLFVFHFILFYFVLFYFVSFLFLTLLSLFISEIISVF